MMGQAQVFRVRKAVLDYMGGCHLAPSAGRCDRRGHVRRTQAQRRPFDWVAP
jgi:hypothetical protein